MKLPTLERRGISCLSGVLFALLAVGSAPGAEYPVFGPADFVQAAGAPALVTRTFEVSAPGEPALLRIRNGGAEGTIDSVSSAVVTLNGVEVVSPADFNQNVERIEKSVTLEAENELTVELRGVPGSGFTLGIFGEVPPEPPTISISRPSMAFVTAAETIELQGTLSGIIESVEVAGRPARFDGESFAASGIPLVEGTNLVVATATDAAGRLARATVSVRRDSSPPSTRCRWCRPRARPRSWWALCNPAAFTSTRRHR